MLSGTLLIYITEYSSTTGYGTETWPPIAVANVCGVVVILTLGWLLELGSAGRTSPSFVTALLNRSLRSFSYWLYRALKIKGKLLGRRWCRIVLPVNNMQYELLIG